MTLRSMRDVPGPRSLAAHWDLFHRRYHYGEVLHELWERHGDVFRVPVPGRDVVLLAHPEEILAVLASKAHYFRIFGQDMLRRITPWGLVATEGQVHDDNRARMMLAMRKVLARRVPEVAVHTCRKRLARLRDGDTLDVGSLAREVTLGVAASILSPPSDEACSAHPDEGEFAARPSPTTASET